MRHGLALCLALAACDRVDVHRIELTFSLRANSSAPDAGSLSGFTCSTVGPGDAGGIALTRRALAPTSGPDTRLALSMAVQAFSLADNPGCRDTKLYNYCTLGSCTFLPDSTFCVELSGEPLPSNATQRDARLNALLADLVTGSKPGLSGALYTLAPLEGWVLLRAVGTTESCAEVLAPDHTFDPGRLIGCAFTCPVMLSTWTGKLWFDSAGAGRCEPQVEACAGRSFSPIAPDPD